MRRPPRVAPRVPPRAFARLIVLVVLASSSSTARAARVAPRASFARAFRNVVVTDRDAHRDADAVRALPGFDAELPAVQFSGFLDASASTPGARLHYWFAAREGSGDWRDAPTALWLNGGPGSSSILGFLQENGPVLVNASGGLMRNPYAWTRMVNLVAMESPAGVGWSYCDEMRTGGDCARDDVQTAADATAAVVDFFRKFPELRRNKFYIAGESYAGVYVPTLARALLDRNDAQTSEEAKIPLAGIATGDPCTDNESQRESMSMLWYGHKYGFVPDAEFHLLWHKCGHRYMSPRTSGRWNGRASTRLLDVFADELEKSGRDEECRVAHRKFLWQTSDAFSQDWRFAFLNDLSLFGPAAVVEGGESIPGTLDYMMTRWMMRDDVRHALHVESSPAKSWPGPTENWSYTSSWSACNENADANTPSMLEFYRSLAPRLERTIVFNGDTDPCVSYEGTRAAIIKLGFDELPGGSQRPYFYNASAVAASFLQEKPLSYGPDLSVIDAGPQFAGHVTDYDHRLSFVTVHGAGHMVPKFRPRVGILKKLLTGDPFSPPLPVDAALRDMTDDEFRRRTEAWVVDAQSAEYINFT